jgi:hypothetical protein
MQKDSLLLSHTGIKYYKKTDVKVYNEIKRKYLSAKWADSDVETQIKELAHNIRNTHNNRGLKQNRINRTNQYNLFELKT